MASDGICLQTVPAVTIEYRKGSVMQIGMLDWSIIIVFFAAVISLGLYKSRAEKTSEDYFLAGRGLKWWLIGVSLIAANISAEQFVGMSGQAARGSIGLAVASYEWIAAITLIIVAFFFLPKFLKSGIFTIPEYLEYRFNHAARIAMSALMVIIYAGVTIPTVTYLGAKALDPLFTGSVLGIEINIVSLSWVVGLLAAVYVAAGGLKACAWADLLQGTALIVGGAIVLVLAFEALDNPSGYEGVDAAAVHQSLGVAEGAPLMDKLGVLKDRKMHMVLPRSSDFLPWTALLLGIWIPNLYYWGLNQYIMQRTLGAHSLREGQRGVVFAAFLKLIIPFIVCIPGIIAFTLYSGRMHQNAMEMKALNGPVLAVFAEVEETPQSSEVLFPFDRDFAELQPDYAERLFRFNTAAAAGGVSADTPLLTVKQAAADCILRTIPAFEADLAQTPLETMDLSSLNSKLVSAATGSYRPFLKKLMSDETFAFTAKQELVGYDYDGAFPLLIRYLMPRGLRGFVLAALMGAVISSLAAMFNAGSTIFTMDIYKELLNRNAGQRQLVFVGRLCVGVLVVIGCLIAPVLANPEFRGAFAFIQEFQGFISPGILTIFLFGLFVRRAPRMCGVLGLVLSPVIYGALFFGWDEIAFLNRMAITVGIIALILAVLTLIHPLKEAVVLPEQTKIELAWSKGSICFGLLVVLLTVLLYIIFY